VARSKLPTAGPGHIAARKKAISDPMVNYLIVTMLEAHNWHDDEDTFRIPVSLVVLIRHQLCGTEPDLHKECRARQHRQYAGFLVGKRLAPGEKVSVRKVADMVCIPRSTAARWLADPVFQHALKIGEQTAARDRVSHQK
jgi:hypothetical protein